MLTGITCRHIINVTRLGSLVLIRKGNFKKVECGKLMIKIGYCRYQCTSGHIRIYPTEQYDGQAILGKINGDE
jgi:hypothetical protein